MKTKYKVLIALAIIAVLGLTGFLVWWFKFRNKSKYLHKRVKEYIPPVKEDVHKKITEDKDNSEVSNSVEIPKVVYLTYHDIDMIPPQVIEDLKKYCHGYKVEIYRHQSCEDFLYKYYGADVMQLFGELDPLKKSTFWALCRIYVNGGYYLNIRKKFTGHISDLPSSTKTVNMSHKGRNLVALSSKPRAPELWNLIMSYFPKIKVIQQEGHIVHYDIPTQVYRNFPIEFTSSIDELIYRHRNLPVVDPKKIDVPVLYINMDKHTERRKSMEAQLEGVTSVTRVPGVLVTDKKYQPLPPYSVTKGELGCTMAHRNAWQTFMDNKDWEKVLILEDDAALRLSSRWKKRLSELQTPVFLAQGGTAYILDRETGKYLLDHFNKRPVLDIPVDSWMWKMLETNEYSQEQVGFSNDTARKCDTLYYIYTYNAEEEIPTSITDRRYGTDVRHHYAEIAVNLIKKSTSDIDLLTIDPQGAVMQNIGKPVIAILDFEEEDTFFNSLLNMYDNRFRVEVYIKKVLGPSYRKKKRDHIKFFELDYSNIYEKAFNKIIKPEYSNFVVKDKFKTINFNHVINTTYSVDCHGFPTTRNTKGQLPSCFLSKHVEEGERHVASMFTRPNACVLELGGGSGAVSVIVQQMLKNKGNHVVVQPEKGEADETPMFGGIDNLSKNKKACQCEYHIIDHVLKVGEGEEIQRLVSKPFDTLVVDCEGCLVNEYRKNPGLFSHVTMIQVERDDIIIEGSDNYAPLLTDIGFNKIHDGVGCDGRCPTEVWVRTLENPEQGSQYGEGSKQKSPMKIDVDEAKDFCKQDTPGCSQFEQAGILAQIYSQIGTTNKYFVEFGARRPQILNSSYFRMKEGWYGLLLDGSPLGNAPNTGGEQEDSRILLNAKDDDRVRLRQAFLTKDNINTIFTSHRVPRLFDLLTIDIDRNDYHILESLNLKRFTPRVIAVEFSGYFNSDEHCVSRYYPDGVWDGKSITGCSLRALNDLMNKRGYSYVAHAAGEHAIFVINSELSYEDVNKEIPHIIPHGWQYESRVGKKYAPYDPSDFQCKDAQTKEGYSSKSEMKSGKDHWPYLERDHLVG